MSGEETVFNCVLLKALESAYYKYCTSMSKFANSRRGESDARMNCAGDNGCPCHDLTVPQFHHRPSVSE